MREYPFRDNKENVYCSMLYKEQDYQQNIIVQLSHLLSTY